MTAVQRKMFDQFAVAAEAIPGWKSASTHQRKDLLALFALKGSKRERDFVMAGLNNRLFSNFLSYFERRGKKAVKI